MDPWDEAAYLSVARWLKAKRIGGVLKGLYPSF